MTRLMFENDYYRFNRKGNIDIIIYVFIYFVYDLVKKKKCFLYGQMNSEEQSTIQINLIIIFTFLATLILNHCEKIIYNKIYNNNNNPNNCNINLQ